MLPRSTSLPLAGLLGTAVLLLVGGCQAAPVRTAAPAAAPSRTVADVGQVRVTGKVGAKPSVQVPAPFTVRTTQKKVLVEGDGPPLEEGQRVTADYLGVNGADGKEFNSSFGARPSNFVLDKEQYLPGLVSSIVGVPVGSRVLVAIPPADAYGVEGQPSVGIGPTDTIVVVVDVKAARDVLAAAVGTPVEPPAGLPTVKASGSAAPTITVPSGPAPSDLVVQPLIRGKGPVVTKGQQITVHYSGVVWPGGKEFDSSWKRKTPATFPIGQGQVVAGWDEGLVGQPVGSRVLLVIPPDKGYGAAGKPSAGIQGTDTLVFVVDILDAATT